jgi:hypothetical protein
MDKQGVAMTRRPARTAGPRIIPAVARLDRAPRRTTKQQKQHRQAAAWQKPPAKRSAHE